MAYHISQSNSHYSHKLIKVGNDPKTVGFIQRLLERQI